MPPRPTARTVKYRPIDTSDNRWFAGRILKAPLVEHREGDEFVGFEGPMAPIAKHPAVVIIERLRTESKTKSGVSPQENEQRAVSSVG